jgi:ribosomal protein L11 methylase PrmA
MRVNHIDDHRLAQLREAVDRLANHQKALSFDEQRDFADWLRVWLDNIETVEIKDDTQ